jgi:hypothetical protein
VRPCRDINSSCNCLIYWATVVPRHLAPTPPTPWTVRGEAKATGLSSAWVLTLVVILTEPKAAALESSLVTRLTEALSDPDNSPGQLT